MNIALFGTDISLAYGEKIGHLVKGLSREGVRLSYYADLFPFLRQVADTVGFQLPEGPVFSSYEDLGELPDLFLALGGDGTFLHSLSIVRDRDVKVAGINFGRLGFLTTAKVEGGENDWIDLLLDGKYDVIRRTTLKISSESLPEGFFPYALNEISIQRRTPYMIGIDLKINGIDIPTYWADGLLIATPTGSTAYSLSVGGPIVTPEAGVFVISPIAPHNLNVRPLIVPQDAVIDMKISSRADEVMLTVDNRELIIPSSSTICLSRGDFSMKTVSLKKEGFFQALQEKLLWGADKRNNL
jgi:NAD+ kinase